MKFVVYTSDATVFVTTLRAEKEFIREWFTEGGWDLKEFDRTEIKNEHGVKVSARLKVG